MAQNGGFRFDVGEVKQTLFITGTDTGVGKTVLTVLLAQFLRSRGVRVAALKPVCSGGRADAVSLCAALNGVLTLDEINPWQFRAPIAPALAAQVENKSVRLASVLAHIRALRGKFSVTLVEGAGGLLSPLGENFDSRDLMVALRATPIIVASNKLGAVNHVLLTLAALPKNLRMRARVVLTPPPKPDPATASNAMLLGQFFPPGEIFPLPWLGENFPPADALKKPQLKRMLAALVAA
jgi:dethiobiotin synthetase